MKERAESTEKMLNDEFRKLEESVNRELTSNESLIRGLTLSGTKTHVKQRFLPLTPLLMVSDDLWSPVLPA
ncbi:TPA: MbeB family mobilization protein [Escherichia coli]